jgi:YidC/Oxa1 family membrane protein insertase
MDRRTVLAIVACLGVLIGFSWLSNNLYPPPKKPRTTAAQDAVGESDAPDGAAEAGDEAPPPAPEMAAGPAPAPGAEAASAPTGTAVAEATRAEALASSARTIDLKLGALGLTVDTAGARITRLVPGDYQDADAETPLDLLRAFRDQPDTALALRVPGSPVDAGTAPWRVVEEGPDVIVMEQRTGDGLWLTKRFAPHPQSPYALAVTVSIENRGAAERLFAYDLTIAGGIHPEEPTKTELTYGVAGVSVDDEVELESEESSSLPKLGDGEPKKLSGALTFGGVASKYFTIALLPDQTHPSKALRLYHRTGVLEGARGDFEATVPGALWTVDQLSLAPGERIDHGYTVYAGPKREQDVEPFSDRGLPLVVDLSSYVPLASSLSVIFLKLLEWMHAVVASYGIAIIILTLLVRGTLHPLSKASQRSTMKMQKLAPVVNEIRESYKEKTSREQQQKMNTEIMELYKKNGASPLAGCLPMVLQLPVFIGLYNALAYDIELRQTQFLYITDLSKPDRLFDFGVAAPWPVEGYLNLLPILMVFMMIAQQRLMPKPPDPQQQSTAKMMQFVMVAFGVMFYTVPSGLVLYFLTSSLVGTLETRWIRKKLETEDMEVQQAGPVQAPKATRQPKKSRRVKGGKKRDKKKKFV